MSSEKNHILDEEDLIAEIGDDLSSISDVPVEVKRLFEREYGEENDDEDDPDLEQDQEDERAKLKKEPNKKHNRRERKVKSKTIPPTKKLTEDEERMKELFGPHELISRPRSRAECLDGLRPCPFASCRHHLYVDVTKRGSLKLNFPDLELDEIPETCSLDVADRGGLETLKEIGGVLNLTRDGLRRIEKRALLKVKLLLSEIFSESEPDS